MAITWLVATVHIAKSDAASSRPLVPQPVIQNPKPDIRNPKSPVPLGGIGCGTFDVLPNGRFARATINNNWERPIETLRACFAAIWTRGGGRSSAQLLTAEPEYGLPGTPEIEFDGFFPRADLKVANARLPVTVTLRAYSSLVPQDLKNSSIPAALFVFTVKNEANAPIEASVAVSWENLLGVGGTAGKGAFADRTGNTIAPLPVTGGIFGLRMASPDRQLIAPPTRLPYNARGTYALMAAPMTPETVVTTAAWNALDARPGWWTRFAEEGTVDGTVAAGAEGRVHPAGVVAMKVRLKENETRELPFAVAWHTPRFYSLTGTEYGHFYERSFDDAEAVGRYALENRQSHLALLNEWQNRLLRSSLPAWLARRVMNDASVLFTHTILTRDSGVGGTAPGPYRFGLLERATDGPMTIGSVESRLAVHGLLLSWFPALDQLELGETAMRRDPSGAIPASLGSVEEGFTPAPVTGDPHIVSAYVHQIARRFRWTGDQSFLDRLYPAAKHAMEHAASQDKNGDGVPDVPSGGGARRDAEVRLLWLAACATARDLATGMADRGFARKCEEWIAAIERRPAVDISDADLIVAAGPAVWMASVVGATSPTLKKVQDRLVAYMSSAARSAVAGLGSTVDVLAMGVTAAQNAQGWDSAYLAAAVVAAQPGTGHADCSLAWLAGLEQLSSPRERRRPCPTVYETLFGLAGVRLDLPAGRLTLAPSLPVTAKSLTAPIFAPTFWASLEFRASPSSARIAFRLDRIMPANPARKKQNAQPTSATELPAASLHLTEVVLPDRPERMTTEVTASVGRAPIPGKSSRRDDGRLVFTFDTPLALTVGQTLGFTLR